MITILTSPVVCSSHGSRREAEVAASASLARRVAGPKAVIDHYPDGAPFIPGFPLHISLSHCRSLAVIAVSSEPDIGVDAEVWREQLRHVVGKFLSPEETPVWGASPRLLLLAWTIKEAVYKAARTPGLPLHGIVLPHPGSSQLTAATPDGRSWLIASEMHDEVRVTTASIYNF